MTYLTGRKAKPLEPHSMPENLEWTSSRGFLFLEIEMNALTTVPEATKNIFEALRLTKDDGTEYWSARDLQQALGYTNWRFFHAVVQRAKDSALNSGVSGVADQFEGTLNMVLIGSKSKRAISDVHLSRYAAYLVAMNGDPQKTEIAAAQRYFALATRTMELAIARDQTSQVAILEYKNQRLLPLAEVAEKFLLEPRFLSGKKLVDLHNTVVAHYKINMPEFFEVLRKSKVLWQNSPTRPMKNYVVNSDPKKVWFTRPLDVSGDYEVTPAGAVGILRLMREHKIPAVTLTQRERNALIEASWSK